MKAYINQIPKYGKYIQAYKVRLVAGIKIVGFDFENTLAYKEPVSLATSVARACCTIGIPISEQNLGAFLQRPFEEVWQLGLEGMILKRFIGKTVNAAFEVGLQPEELVRMVIKSCLPDPIVLSEAQLHQIIGDVQNDYRMHWLPGAQETILDMASRGFQVGILTNLDWFAAVRARELVAAFNQQHGLEVPLVDSATVGCKKPDPEAFQRLLIAIGFEPDDELPAASSQTALYVGDGGSNEIQRAGRGDPRSPWGVTTGCGFFTVLVTGQEGYAQHHPGEVEPFADRTILTIGELPTVLSC